MPRKKSEATSKTPPKTAPKRVPTRVSKSLPKTEPESVPNPVAKIRPKQISKLAPIAAPIVSPEGYAISFYSLLNWEADHSTSPHSYGNRGMALYQAHTEADGKAWLRDNEYYGHFAAVERINGKIGKSWHVEIEPLEEETIGNDYSYLDPDDIGLTDSDLLNPELVKSKIREAKLQAQLEATRNGHGGLGELIEGVRFVEEIKKQAAPQKSLVEQIREAKEIVEIVTPRREVNPAPAPPPARSEEEVLAGAILKQPEVIENVVGSVLKRFGSSGKSDSGSGWEDVAMEAVKNGQASQIVRELINGIFNGFQSFIPQRGNNNGQAQMAQAPIQNHGAENQNQSIQSPASLHEIQGSQIQPQGATDMAQTGAHPNGQQQQLMPVDALIYSLIGAMERQAPMTEARNIVNINVIRNPELGDSIDEILSLPVDQIMSMLIAYHPPIAQMAHAREWLQSLINSLTAEETGEFKETEL